MSPNASRRLLQRGSYLQSDIAFQCIVDFLEFELACMDRDSNTRIWKAGKGASEETGCRVALRSEVEWESNEGSIVERKESSSSLNGITGENSAENKASGKPAASKSPFRFPVTAAGVLD
ncbi:hypothetical protein B0H14DRAFT_2586540 [Mycena olivaceomarginata]|nr:hypothetical protein B0H14DRAFT_2586540 [Mycena olivaceomarginata]